MARLITVLKIVQYTISILNGQTVACSIRDLELTVRPALPEEECKQTSGLASIQSNKTQRSHSAGWEQQRVEETFPLQSAFKCVTFYCPCWHSLRC